MLSSQRYCPTGHVGMHNSHDATHIAFWQSTPRRPLTRVHPIQLVSLHLHGALTQVGAVGSHSPCWSRPRPQTVCSTATQRHQRQDRTAAAEDQDKISPVSRCQCRSSRPPWTRRPCWGRGHRGLPELSSSRRSTPRASKHTAIDCSGMPFGRRRTSSNHTPSPGISVST